MARTDAAERAIAALRQTLNRQIQDEAAEQQRDRDARAWLDEHRSAELADGGFLRALAAHFAATTDAERAMAQDDVFRIFAAAERAPVDGFEQPTRRALLLRGLRLAETGEWQACGDYLPFLARHYDDHAALYWLVGRRARDHGSTAGKAFLHDVIVPALLLDPTLDDTDRVTELRRLWDVFYTGPRPFRHLEGPTLDGATLSTEAFAGKVLLVDYWATWCRPCLMQMPGVVDTWRRFKDQGLVVVGVALDSESSRAKVVETVQRLGMGWPQLFDGVGTKSDLMTRNRVTAIPATFLLDRHGRVRWTGLEGEELPRRVEELLREKD